MQRINRESRHGTLSREAEGSCWWSDQNAGLLQPWRMWHTQERTTMYHSMCHSMYHSTYTCTAYAKGLRGGLLVTAANRAGYGCHGCG